MEVHNLNLRELRNNEHFQLHTEVRDLILASDPIIEKIKELLDDYFRVYMQEDECIQKILKSNITEKRHYADKERDTLFRGMVNAVKSAQNHFDSNVTEAAGRLNILFNTYGNVARKPYNEETAALNNLLSELKGKYASDVATLKLEDWVNELEIKNRKFDSLMKERFSELEQRTELKAKAVREEVDKAYHAITKQINALMLVEKSPVYETFIHQLNVRIEEYRLRLAQRKGRSGSKDDEYDEES
jgi:flagellar biosynthesis chaperone FliJ